MGLDRAALKPFTNRLECPKCGQERFSWHWLGAPGNPEVPAEDVLLVTCQNCLWFTEMEPKDA